MFGVWRTRDGDTLHAGGAFQFERLHVRVMPWRVVVAASALGAYVVGLLLYLPAEAAIGGEREAIGTVWNGETALEPGFALGWSLDPVQTVASLTPSGDVKVRGPGTALAADVSWRSNAVMLRRADGVASLRLANALAPALPFACDGEATFRAADLAVGGGRVGTGLLRAGPANCQGAGLSTATPPLVGEARSDVEGSTMTLRAVQSGELARARLARGGTISVTVTPIGATLLPGVAAGTIDIQP